VLEAKVRILKEDDLVEIVPSDPSHLEAGAGSAERQRRVVLHPAELLFRERCDQLAIDDERRRGFTAMSRNTEHACHVCSVRELQTRASA